MSKLIKQSDRQPEEAGSRALRAHAHYGFDLVVLCTHCAHRTHGVFASPDDIATCVVCGRTILLDMATRQEIARRVGAPQRGSWLRNVDPRELRGGRG